MEHIFLNFSKTIAPKIKGKGLGVVDGQWYIA